MGTCCMSKFEREKKRHPLLRHEHHNSLADSSYGLEASASLAVASVRSMESRARLDAIRGPPLFFVDKLPDAHESDMAPTKVKHHELIRANLKSGVKPTNVELPKGYSRITWLNVHIKDFHDHIRTFNKHVLNETCTKFSCSKMSERPGHFFVWHLNDNGRFSTSINKKLSAPEYISKVIQLNSALLSRIVAIEQDESGGEEDFKSAEHEEICHTMVKLIFQVYCHILYWHHDAFVEMDALPHLNTCFKWFIFFSSEMQLLEEEDARPLQNLIDRIYDLENNRPSDDDMAPSISLCPDDKSSLYSDDISKLTTPSFDTNDRNFSDDNSTLHNRM